MQMQLDAVNTKRDALILQLARQNDMHNQHYRHHRTLFASDHAPILKGLAYTSYSAWIFLIAVVSISTRYH